MSKRDVHADVIDSPANPKIKFAASLRERKERESANLFLVEGNREIARALECGYEVKEFFFCDAVADDQAREIAAKRRLVKRWDVSERAFAKLAVRDSSGGLIAVFQMQHTALADLPKKAQPFYLIIDGVEKPGNLGALLRTADGAGVDAVLISGEKVDRFNPHTIRASVGTVFSVPVVGANAETIHEFCKQRNARIFAASPEAKKVYHEADFSAGVAIALGAEDFGLAAYWDKHADEHVKIPMQGIADSLNVAASGAILLYSVQQVRKQ